MVLNKIEKNSYFINNLEEGIITIMDFPLMENPKKTAKPVLIFFLLDFLRWKYENTK